MKRKSARIAACKNPRVRAGGFLFLPRFILQKNLTYF